jgi:hypothetical protein
MDHQSFENPSMGVEALSGTGEGAFFCVGKMAIGTADTDGTFVSRRGSGLFPSMEDGVFKAGW